MLKTYMAYFVCFLLLLSCKAQEYTPEDFPKAQFLFGTGGGFTGHVKTYTLLENGQIFFENSLKKNSEQMNKVDLKACKQVFNQAKALNLMEIDYKKPGNMYRFIEYKSKGQSNRVVWSEGQDTVPTGIGSLYKKLLKLIPKNSDK